METQLATPSTFVRATSPGTIDLRIAGEGLLLEGRFGQWFPVALLAGRGGDPGAVQLLVDATSPANQQGGPRRAPGADGDLFRLVAEEVRRVGPSAFAAKGTLQSDGGEHPVEVVVHSPEGHTPFVFLTVPLDRDRFDALWTTFEDLAATAGGEPRELRPQAWLRVPVLAAA
jgi:hypothetical protein